MKRSTKLRAKKARSKYKSDLAYMRAIYRNNKQVIDEAFPPEDFYNQSSWTSFRRYIEDQLYQHDPITMKVIKNRRGKPKKISKVQNVVETIARSEKFTSKFERLTANALSGLNKYPAAYRKFRELTKVRGRYTKIDTSKLEWQPDINGYLYNDEVVVIFKNSPARVEVYTLGEYAQRMRE